MTKLWEALALLQGGKAWMQGDSSDDKMCILGAIAEAGEHGLWCAVNESDPDMVEVAEVIKAQYPDRSHPENTAFNRCWTFNDHPQTTFADVERVMEKAAIRRDEFLS